MVFFLVADYRDFSFYFAIFTLGNFKNGRKNWLNLKSIAYIIPHGFKEAIDF